MSRWLKKNKFLNFDLPGRSRAPFLQVLAGTRQSAGAIHPIVYAASWWKHVETVEMLPLRQILFKNNFNKSLYIHLFLDIGFKKTYCERLAFFISSDWIVRSVGGSMDLRKDSKALSCATLQAGCSWMERQPQPRLQQPAVKAWKVRKLFGPQTKQFSYILFL